MKLTAFSRFLIVMVFVTPLAYLAASYYNGEDGIQNIKELLGIDRQAEDAQVAPAPAPPPPASEDSTDQEAAPAGRNLEQENDQLRERVRQLEMEVEALKKEIQTLKSPQPANQ